MLSFARSTQKPNPGLAHRIALVREQPWQDPAIRKRKEDSRKELDEGSRCKAVQFGRNCADGAFSIEDETSAPTDKAEAKFIMHNNTLQIGDDHCSITIRCNTVLRYTLEHSDDASSALMELELPPTFQGHFRRQPTFDFQGDDMLWRMASKRERARRSDRTSEEREADAKFEERCKKRKVRAHTHCTWTRCCSFFATSELTILPYVQAEYDERCAFRTPFVSTTLRIMFSSREDLRRFAAQSKHMLLRPGVPQLAPQSGLWTARRGLYSVRNHELLASRVDRLSLPVAFQRERLLYNGLLSPLELLHLQLPIELSIRARGQDATALVVAAFGLLIEKAKYTVTGRISEADHRTLFKKACDEVDAVSPQQRFAAFIKIVMTTSSVIIFRSRPLASCSRALR